MSYWDGKKTVRWDPEPYPEADGWWRVDCGCCNGLEWGGEYPQECSRCHGNGYVAVHKASGAAAAYPGGPFRGQDEIG